MLSARGAHHACSKRSLSTSLLLRRNASRNMLLKQSPCLSTFHYHQTHLSTRHRSFTTTRSLFQTESTELKPPSPSPDDIEKVVRDAKQRFRDTLPKDYLSEEEYALYVRLYGPPLRETEPEDVGIHTHMKMDPELPGQDVEGVILKELEDGSFQEIAYDLPPRDFEEDADSIPEEDFAPEDLEALETALAEAEAQSLVEKAPGYVETIARNPREADAMHKLAESFEKSQKARKEAEAEAAAQEADEVTEENAEASSWPEEEEFMLVRREDEQNPQRFHPHTLAGSFHGTPVEILLPKDEFVKPVSELLQRSHLDHVRTAAEAAFGGPGLPRSAEMVLGRKAGHMGGVGLLGDQRHMTEIEADAFLAGFMAPAYASVFSIIREVRRRVGSDWIQSKLKNGGPGLSVLDAGSGGAGLLAWDQVLRAEWGLLKEKGEVKGAVPPGKQTVIATSDRLRNRLKTFLHDTTFLPRMPDYEHSGEMRGPRLDGGDQQQQRKSYDVIIASHLLLREKEDHRRQAVLNNLWHLLKKDGGVLIIVEKAHPRGFEAVAHARDTMLNQFMLDEDGNPRISEEEFNPTFHREPEPGHVIAPCTNQGTCPMYPEPGKSVGRKDYCHFSQRFVRPHFYARMLRKKNDIQGEVEFSYVAVQRGVAKTNSLRGKEATEAAQQGYENADQPDMQTLPRLLLPALKRKGHVTMDMCTPEGKIERWTVPKSFSKLAYHDARKSRWGDLWALGAKTRVPRNLRIGHPDDGGRRSAAEAEISKKGKPQRVDIDGDRGTTRVTGEIVTERRGKGNMKKRYVLDQLRRAGQMEEAELSRELDAEVDAELEEMERGDRRQ